MGTDDPRKVAVFRSVLVCGYGTHAWIAGRLSACVGKETWREALVIALHIWVGSGSAPQG